MKKALITWGGWDGHCPEKVAGITANILKNEGFSVDIFNTLDVFSDLSELSSYDIILPYWTMGNISDEYVENILKAVEAGTGIVGCHGFMADSFRNSPRWQFMAGAQWVEHPGWDKIQYVVNIKKNSSSPIIKGISDFTVTSEHYYLHVDPVVNILATTRFPVYDAPHSTNGEVDMPVAYTKLWGKGRIFYCSIGHSPDLFDKEEVIQLHKNGLLWAAR